MQYHTIKPAFVKLAKPWNIETLLQVGQSQFVWIGPVVKVRQAMPRHVVRANYIRKGPGATRKSGSTNVFLPFCGARMRFPRTFEWLEPWWIQELGGPRENLFKGI